MKMNEHALEPETKFLKKRLRKKSQFPAK